MHDSGEKAVKAVLLTLLLGFVPPDAARAAGTDREVLGGSLAIASTVSLQFGRITPSTVSGSVAMTPLGVRVPTGGVTLLNGGTPTAASFTVTGTPLRVYGIVLPPNGAVSLTSGGGPPMALNNFLSLPALLGTLSLAGTQNLLVGATLSVGASQPGGSYSGMFNVTVAFD